MWAEAHHHRQLATRLTAPSANSAMPWRPRRPTRRRSFDAGDVGQRFLEAGLPDTYTNTLLKQARKVVRLLQQGQFIAHARRGPVVADFADDEDDDQ